MHLPYAYKITKYPTEVFKTILFILFYITFNKKLYRGVEKVLH
jgi:hypothetical protein